MKIFPTDKDPIPPTPGWMRIALVIFILMMAYTGYQNEKRYEAGDASAVSIKKYQVVREFGDIDRWRRILDPGFARSLKFEEIQTGRGDFAACGQQVKISTQAQLEKDQPWPESVSQQTELSFRIGDGTVLEAFDKGVRGMQVGGVRRVWAGARLVDSAVKDPDADDYQLVLELKAMTPNLKEGQELQYLVQGHGEGLPAHCGQDVAVRVRVLNAQETAVYESPMDVPLRWRLGDGTYGHGFDRGVPGMLMGEVRLLRIPAAYLPPQDTLPVAIGKNDVVEVQRLPYNQPLSTPSSQESPHEPEPVADRLQAERDSTLPDDGGDRQSSGAESGR